MKTKYLPMLVLMVFAGTQVGHAANITVGYQNYNTVYNLETDAPLAPSSLVWLGSWQNGTNPTSILSDYFAGSKSFADVSSAFLVGSTSTYGIFGDGSEAYGFTMSDVGFTGRNVDMILWNASTVQTSTQAAAFRWNNSVYPDGASVDTEVQVANVLPSMDPEAAVSMLYGTAQDSGSDGIGYIFTAGSAAVPEPSTVSMLIAGIALVITNVRKSRNS